MIISASYKTDIPAFYSEWLFNRLAAGFCKTVNPYNLKESIIDLTPEKVDVWCFWTKNFQPLYNKINTLQKKTNDKFYIQHTLTGYGSLMEPNLPAKEEIIKTIQNTSKVIGKERLIWRFDPIIVLEKGTERTIERFEYICQQLHNYVNHIVISFYIPGTYSNADKRVNGLLMKRPALGNFINPFERSQQLSNICMSISDIAKKHGLQIFSCGTESNLDAMNISKSACIDKTYIEKTFKINVSSQKQYKREACGCIKSSDIGSYSTCKFGCLYCYASNSKSQYRHDPKSEKL